MDYFQKVDQKPTPDLTWNLPETKQGTVNIIGGNSQSFRTEVKISEYLAANYPIKTLNVILPDALQSKLPKLPNFTFLPSTDTGSFVDNQSLATTIDSADFTLLLGDLSKNSATTQAVSSACQIAAKPLLITRDAVDIIAAGAPEQTLMNDQLILFASMPSLIKLLRAIYYPKMLLLSQSLVQVADVLHKFTLSYPAKLITLHSEHLLVAEAGQVAAVPLAKSGYLPLTVWNGELAARITALNLYNPHNYIAATLTALFPPALTH